jgi:hypothetical protein
MTRAQRALGYASLFLAAWTALQLLVRFVLDIGEATGASMSLWERAIIYAYMLVLRNLPFLVLPVLMAPTAVILLWLVPRTRPTLLEPPESERQQLLQWLAWVAIAVAVILGGAFANHIREGVVPTGIWMWALMASMWAYAGALHRAFRVQRLRETAGTTKVSSTSLAVAALLSLIAQPVGLLLPLWVLWASRATERAAQQPDAADGASRHRPA